MTNKEFNETMTEGYALNKLHQKITAQQVKIELLRAAIANMLYSADAMWEEKNMGHDWPEACDYARDTLKETE